MGPDTVYTRAIRPAAAAAAAAGVADRIANSPPPPVLHKPVLGNAEALELQSQLSEALQLSESLLQERDHLIGERDAAMAATEQSSGEVCTSCMAQFGILVEVHVFCGPCSQHHFLLSGFSSSSAVLLLPSPPPPPLRQVGHMQDFIRAVQSELGAVETRVASQEQELAAGKRALADSHAELVASRAR